MNGPEADELFALVTAEDVEAETSRAVAAAFQAYTAENELARSNQFGPSISMIGGCVRRFVYALAGVPPSDPELQITGENRAANLGTMQHRGLLPKLAAELDAEQERRLVLRVGDDLIYGSADVLSVTRRIVLDLKTKREHGLSRVAAGGVPDPIRLQVGGYGLAAHQEGIRVDWVVYLFLDRASGDDMPVAERWGEDLAMDVLTWVWLAQSYRDCPQRAPRTERGPGLSMACDGCGWLRRCWGADARPGRVGPQRDYGRTNGEVEAAIAEYARLGAQMSELKTEREFWAEVFQNGSKPGRWYGDAYWSRDADGSDDDAKAMREILTELGIPIPKKRRRGNLRVNLR